mmetsp:Transcript_9943/g.25612  ORF Transcript_9943/g.25612 Transcript_9943/m.25612 type:complete len:113 (-) Transcript_9943:1101-1439(-)
MARLSRGRGWGGDEGNGGCKGEGEGEGEGEGTNISREFLRGNHRIPLNIFSHYLDQRLKFPIIDATGDDRTANSNTSYTWSLGSLEESLSSGNSNSRDCETSEGAGNGYFIQ